MTWLAAGSKYDISNVVLVLISGWPVSARHRFRPVPALQPARLLPVGPSVQLPKNVFAGAFQTRKPPPSEVSSTIASPLPG